MTLDFALTYIVLPAIIGALVSLMMSRR